MLYHLLAPLARYLSPLNVLRYITFRAAAAAVTALLISFLVGPLILRRLRRMRLHQVIREGTPESHIEKARTPTMGGLIIICATLVPTLLWARLNNRYIVLAMIVMSWMGAIGFVDDYLKLKQKREGKKNQGLVESNKLVGQITIGVLLGLYIWKFPLATLPGASTTLPFYKYVLLVPVTVTLGWLYVAFVTFVLTGASNAVNITDGLDGLAAGLTAIVAATFAVFAYVMGRVDASAYLQIYYLRGAGELAIFCASMFGAAIGFLWYNAYPAEVFMGDTGSLALGGALGAVAILLKSEFLLAILGGVFVAEMISVIVQRYVFKVMRRRRGLEYAQSHRVFRRAPLHHHYEEKFRARVRDGRPVEPRIVVRFWLVGILLAFLALSTLKLR